MRVRRLPSSGLNLLKSGAIQRGKTSTIASITSTRPAQAQSHPAPADCISQSRA